jgi:basic amino acid/polyamine antiporter, APA family
MKESKGRGRSEGDDSGLARSIGTGMLAVFIIGNILGAGIYAVIGEVAAKSGGLLWASFLLAAVLAGFTAASYAELATKYPQAGGAALYAEKAFDRDWLTVMTTVAVSSSAITSAATSARALAADYLPTLVELPVVPTSLAFIALLTVVNWWGISESLKVNVVLTALIVAGLLLVVGVGIWSLRNGSGEFSALTTLPDETSAWPIALLSGATLAFFAFIGFEDAAQVSEETRQPKRAYPIALAVGIVVAAVLYVLVAAATVLVVTPGELEGAGAPLVAVVEEGSNIPGETIGAVAIVALTNTALLQLVASSRLLYGMARQKQLPPALGRIDRSRQTPWVAIIVVALLAALLAATGDLGTLADTTVTLILTAFVLVNLSVIKLRGDEVDHEHVRVPRFLPWMGAVVSAGLVVWSVAINGLPVALRYVVLLALGLIIWFVQRKVAEHTDLLAVDDIDGGESSDRAG